MFSVDNMTEEAIAFLRKNEPPEGYFLGFSGGKDSIVIRQLAYLAGVRFWMYYSCTRIDPPELVRFIKQYYPDVAFLYPKMTFWEGIKKYSPPLRMQRWCCDILKKNPGKSVPLKHHILGMRIDESVTRSKRKRVDKYAGKTAYKPIFKWTAWHVWEFINKHNLPYPALYDQGFDRLGCVICPFIFGKSANSQAELAHRKNLWPGMFKTFEKVCREWFESEDPDGQRMRDRPEKTFEEYLQAYYRGFRD